MSRALGQGRPNPFGDRPRFRQPEAGQNDQQGLSRPANSQVGTPYCLRQRLAHASNRVTRRSGGLICAIDGSDIEADDAQVARFTPQARQLARDRDVAGGAIQDRKRAGWRRRRRRVLRGSRDRRQDVRLTGRRPGGGTDQYTMAERLQRIDDRAAEGDRVEIEHAHRSDDLPMNVDERNRAEPADNACCSFRQRLGCHIRLEERFTSRKNRLEDGRQKNRGVREGRVRQPCH